MTSWSGSATPHAHPDWLETCEIMHKAANLIAFPMVQDLGSLLWVMNPGCIDLSSLSAAERSAEWEPLAPELAVEVGYDHVSNGRFRHGTRLVRWRPDKAPRQCPMEQLR